MNTNKRLHRFIHYAKKSLFVCTKIVFICVLFYGLKWIWDSYQSWNKILDHQIIARISAEGLLSDDSYCNFKLKIDAGGMNQQINNRDNLNSIEIVSKTNFTDSIKPHWIQDRPMGRTLYDKYKELIDEKATFYLVDFKCYTNINSKIPNKDFVGIFEYKPHTINYVEAPRLSIDSLGTKAEGSGILAFCTRGGNGCIQFNTNLINEAPSINSKWDITQANYSIVLGCDNIKCDTLSIEFVGPTNFSAMYPIPNITTVSSIEFTDSASIKEILSNGLRFHADFVQLKEMSARRTFILSAILSLTISLIASIIFKLIYDRKAL